MCCLFVYLHFMDGLHVLLSTLRLSLRFVPANHRQLSLPFSPCKSLEKVVVYRAASGLWLELVPSQYRTSSVIGGGPVMEDEGNLTVQNPSGRQPFEFLVLSQFEFLSLVIIWVFNFVTFEFLSLVNICQNLSSLCFLSQFNFFWVLSHFWRDIFFLQFYKI